VQTLALGDHPAFLVGLEDALLTQPDALLHAEREQLRVPPDDRVSADARAQLSGVHRHAVAGPGARRSLSHRAAAEGRAARCGLAFTR